MSRNDPILGRVEIVTISPPIGGCETAVKVCDGRGNWLGLLTFSGILIPPQNIVSSRTTGQRLVVRRQAKEKD